jgi:hypothetical protein
MRSNACLETPGGTRSSKRRPADANMGVCVVVSDALIGTAMVLPRPQFSGPTLPFRCPVSARPRSRPAAHRDGSCPLRLPAPAAYRSVQIEAGLEEKGLQSRIHRRAARNRPLSERQKRSKVRARVEHIFGHQQGSMDGKIVRTIGIARARFKIGMMNLGYNIRRLVQLERMAPAPA